jgi:hypothetical protein
VSNDQKTVCQKCGASGARFVGMSHALLVYFWCDACRHTTTVEHPDHEVISALANALQAAVLISTELKAKTVGRLDDFDSLQDVLRNAVTALQKLRRPE